MNIYKINHIHNEFLSVHIMNIYKMNHIHNEFLSVYIMNIYQINHIHNEFLSVYMMNIYKMNHIHNEFLSAYIMNIYKMNHTYNEFLSVHIYIYIYLKIHTRNFLADKNRVCLGTLNHSNLMVPLITANLKFRKTWFLPAHSVQMFFCSSQNMRSSFSVRHRLIGLVPQTQCVCGGARWGRPNELKP
jgi:hypothetical protein